MASQDDDQTYHCDADRIADRLSTYVAQGSEAPATIIQRLAAARAEVPAAEQVSAEDDLAEARTVRVGKTVEVTRGRKVPRGTIGKVTRTYAAAYGLRVCIDGPDGPVWTAATNVDVLDPEEWLGDWRTLRH